MKNIIRRFLTVALLLAFANIASAFDDIVVVNGFKISDKWFDSIDRNFNSRHNENCVIDDEFLIEQMASLVLGMQEAEQLASTFPESTLETIEKIKESGARFEDDTEPNYNADKEAQYLIGRRYSYFELLIDGKVTDEQVVAEYERRVRNKNPEIVNRQLIKYKGYLFDKHDGAREILDLATNGINYAPRLQQMIDNNEFDVSHWGSNGWEVYVQPKLMPEGKTELAVGDVDILDTIKGTRFMEITASKIIPIIGIDEKLPNGYNTTHQQIFQDLKREAKITAYRAMREKAVITLNGEPVQDPDYKHIFRKYWQRTKIGAISCPPIF